MYPSGVWRGSWHQEWYGRQEMQAFELRFDRGAVTGHGVDVVGRFTFAGEYDADGAVRLVKQYLGRHKVLYVGRPDGEGHVVGTWTIPDWGNAGPFVLTPDLPRPTGDEPIHEIRR